MGIEVGVEVADGDGDAVAVGLGLATARRLVLMLDRQVSRVPPAFPVPLHWLIRTGTAGLTLDAEPTAQSAVEPPPVTDPLHWVTVAPVVVAGNGSQTSGPRPP